MRIWLATKAFFRTLLNREVAEAVSAVLESSTGAPQLADDDAKASTKKQAVKEPPKPVRSDAITLLAALQREARFVDFLKEPLDAYSDEQVGAAVRDVHRQCVEVVDRVFDPQPLVEGDEGASIEVPEGFDASRFRLVGNVAGDPPFLGSLVHHGWQATRCDVPSWTGRDEGARVIAPAEVELS